MSYISKTVTLGVNNLILIVLPLGVFGCAPEADHMTHRASKSDQIAGTKSNDSACGKDLAFAAFANEGGSYMDKMLFHKGKVLYCYVHDGVSESTIASRKASYESAITYAFSEWNRAISSHPYWPLKNGIDIKFVHTNSNTVCEDLRNSATSEGRAWIKQWISSSDSNSPCSRSACATMLGGILSTPSAAGNKVSMLHELGHNMGLADSYQDGTIYNYDQNIVAKAGSSVMSGTSQTITNDDKAGIWFSFERIRTVNLEASCGSVGNSFTKNRGSMNTFFCAPNSDLSAAVVMNDLNPQMALKQLYMSTALDPNPNRDFFQEPAVELFPDRDINWRVIVTSPDLDAQIKSVTVTYEGKTTTLQPPVSNLSNYNEFRQQSYKLTSKFSNATTSPEIIFEAEDTKGRKTKKRAAIKLSANVAPKVDLKEYYIQPSGEKINLTATFTHADGPTEFNGATFKLDSLGGITADSTTAKLPANFEGKLSYEPVIKTITGAIGPFQINSITKIIASAFGRNNPARFYSESLVLAVPEKDIVDVPIEIIPAIQSNSYGIVGEPSQFGSSTDILISWASNLDSQGFILKILDPKFAAKDVRFEPFSAVFSRLPTILNQVSTNYFYIKYLNILKSGGDGTPSLGIANYANRINPNVAEMKDQFNDPTFVERFYAAKPRQFELELSGIFHFPDGSKKYLRPVIQRFNSRNPTHVTSQKSDYSVTVNRPFSIPVTLNALAGSRQGSVKFFLGNNMIYESKSPPYALNYKFDTVGKYQVTALSSDENGFMSDWTVLNDSTYDNQGIAHKKTNLKIDVNVVQFEIEESDSNATISTSGDANTASDSSPILGDLITHDEFESLQGLKNSNCSIPQK